MESVVDELGIELTECIARYMVSKFNSILGHSNDNTVRVPFPEEWNLGMLQECDRVVDILVQAVGAKRQMSWSVEEYAHFMIQHCPRATGLNETVERKISAEYPALGEEVSTETRPCVVIDKDGNVIVWYLPQLLSSERQMALWNGLKVIDKSFTINRSSSSWRVNDQYYSKEKCRFRPGSVSVSPAWFQQAHSKSHKMEVSAELRKDRGLKWITDIKESSAILGGAVAIMHPELFTVGVKCFQTLRDNMDLVAKNEGLQAILNAWSSPFSGLSVMNNRQTPPHRDNGGGHRWMDLLATVGPYKNGWMKMPGLGLKLRYNAGTVVGVCGRVVRHGAQADGERACFAFYMRETMVKAIGVGEPDWANIKSIV